MRKIPFRLITGVLIFTFLICSQTAAFAYGSETPWYFESLGVQAAKDAGLTGAGVKIALIDSGVNAEHEDLITADITGYNFLGREPDVTAYGDDAGHGTLAAGVLVACAGNGLGTDGLTPDASLIMLRCFSALGGSANAGSGSKETIQRAVEYAVEQNVDVLNMSIGGTKESLRSLEPVFQQAADAGIILIASVGNGGGTIPYYPAAFDCVTGVGWLNRDGSVSPQSQRNATVYVTAPGQDIYGPDWRTADGYRTDSGTSFASPVVAAMAVMAKQADKGLRTEGFRYLLVQSSHDLGAPGRDDEYGYGAVDIAAFVDALKAPQAVKYETGGGLLAENGYDSFYIIGKGDSVNLPDSDDIVRDGYEFTGWFFDENLEQPANAIPAGSFGRITLYAGWKEAPEESGEPGPEQQICPYCGRTHRGAFGKIISYFHRLFYFFRIIFK